MLKEPPSENQKHGIRFLWLNILAIGVVILLMLFGVLKGLGVYTHHDEEVSVPNVRGMMPNQAEKMFRENGLEAKVVSTSYQRNMPSGTILDLNPGPGEKVKRGRIIFLTINSINAPLREVPDVTENSSAREAEAQLISAGFRLTDNELVDGELDWVYGVLYNGRRIMAGEKIPIGSTLTLQVGNGNSASGTSESDSVENTTQGNEVGLEDNLSATNVTKSKVTKEKTTLTNSVQEKKVKTIKSSSPIKTLKQPQKKKTQPKERKTETSNDSWF